MIGFVLGMIVGAVISITLVMDGFATENGKDDSNDR